MVFSSISGATINNYNEYKNQGVYIKLPPAEAIGLGNMKDELKGIFKEAMSSKKAENIYPSKGDIIVDTDGQYYIVIDESAKHAETDSNMVIYKPISEHNEDTKVAPWSIFTSDKFKIAISVDDVRGSGLLIAMNSIYGLMKK